MKYYLKTCILLLVSYSIKHNDHYADSGNFCLQFFKRFKNKKIIKLSFLNFGLIVIVHVFKFTNLIFLHNTQ